jgi:hypothetical protein
MGCDVWFRMMLLLGRKERTMTRDEEEEEYPGTKISSTRSCLRNDFTISTFVYDIA